MRSVKGQEFSINYELILVSSDIKGAAKLYFMHYRRVVIIFFSKG